MGLKRTWWSVASDIDELKGLAEKLNKEDGGQKARLLSSRITAAIPRFEATEDVGSLFQSTTSITNKYRRNANVASIAKFESSSSSV
jgi:hypothetical protein